jgi:Holliday junction resolvasome RuvABC endonuclease subunit
MSADYAIGFDPSLTHFGYAIAHYDAPGVPVHFIETGVWTTAPTRSEAKTAGYARRCEGLARSLFDLVARFGRPALVACEGTAIPFGRTSMQTVAALGRVRGLVDAFAAAQALTVVEFQPAHLKRLLTGDQKASKATIRAVVETAYPELERLWPARQSDIEHAADAAAALHAALTTQHREG